MKLLLECSLLILPALIYALWNGRNGLKHPNPEQVKNIAIIMILCVTCTRLLAMWYGWVPFAKTVQEVLWWYLKALLVSITGYGLFFPPLMNWVLGRLDRMFQVMTLKGKFLYAMTRLSATAIPDKWDWYANLHWGVRLGLYLGLFVVSIIWFAL